LPVASGGDDERNDEEDLDHSSSLKTRTRETWVARRGLVLSSVRWLRVILNVLFDLPKSERRAR
jgi:hypothetical protein